MFNEWGTEKFRTLLYFRFKTCSYSQVINYTTQMFKSVRIKENRLKSNLSLY